MADTGNIIYDVRMAKPMEDRVISLWLMFMTISGRLPSWKRLTWDVPFPFVCSLSFVLFLIIFIFYTCGYWLVFIGFSIAKLFIARCTLVQSAVLRSHVVCPSVSPSVCNVGGFI